MVGKYGSRQVIWGWRQKIHDAIVNYRILYANAIIAHQKYRFRCIDFSLSVLLTGTIAKNRPVTILKWTFKLEKAYFQESWFFYNWDGVRSQLKYPVYRRSTLVEVLLNYSITTAVGLVFRFKSAWIFFISNVLMQVQSLTLLPCKY